MAAAWAECTEPCAKLLTPQLRHLGRARTAGLAVFALGLCSMFCTINWNVGLVLCDLCRRPRQLRQGRYPKQSSARFRYPPRPSSCAVSPCAVGGDTSVGVHLPVEF